MGNLQVITQSEFTKKSWKARPNYLFAAKDTTCPLGLGELSRAATAMPSHIVRFHNILTGFLFLSQAGLYLLSFVFSSSSVFFAQLISCASPKMSGFSFVQVM